MGLNQEDCRKIEMHANALYHTGHFLTVVQQVLPYWNEPSFKAQQLAFELAADSAHRIGRIDLSIRLWFDFLRRFPKHKMGYLSLADILCKNSRFDEAEACFKQALVQTGASVELCNNYAIFLQSRGRTDDAISQYRHAIAARPDVALPYGNLAALLRQQQSYEKAEPLYKKSLEIQPGNLDTWLSLTRLYISMDEYQKAEMLMIDADKRFPQPTLGQALLRAELDGFLEKHASAEQRYYQIMQQFPDDLFDVYFCFATYLGNADRRTEAIDYYHKARQIRPDDANVHLNLGTVFQQMGDFEQAEFYYEKARQLQPDLMDAYANLGIVMYKTNRWPEAEAICREGLARNPDHHRTRFTMGYVLLSQGRFEEGWPFYESRYSMEGTKKSPLLSPPLSFPQWRGEDLRGKSILIWNEQGTGDLIQFSRLFPMLRQKGLASLNVICAPGNRELLQGMTGVDRVYCFSEDKAVPHHSYWSFALSLPLYLGINQHNAPRNVPYIHALPTYVATWKAKLSHLSGKKVGLVWKGSPKNVVDKDRSLHDIALLKPIWDVGGVNFISLQKDCATEIAAHAAQHNMFCCGDDLQQFSDTAGLISHLDLIITVDTSVAHLAGAMGKQVWMMIPFSGDWRWLTGIETSHWYPTMRIFRQKKRGDWPAVIARIAHDLKEWSVEP